MPIRKPAASQPVRFARSQPTIVCVRRDIHCGINGCKQCTLDGAASPAIDASQPYILILDSAFILSYPQIFDSALFACLNVIVPESLLEVVGRLNKARCSFLREHRPQNARYFPNNVCADTQLQETPTDSRLGGASRDHGAMEDAILLSVAQYYYKHAASSPTSVKDVIVLCADESIRASLRAMLRSLPLGTQSATHIRALSLAEFFSEQTYDTMRMHAPGSARLTSLLEICPSVHEFEKFGHAQGADTNTAAAFAGYPQHLSAEKCVELIKSGKVLKGKFKGLSRGKRGEVITYDAGKNTLFLNPYCCNRAVHGDTVAFRLLAPALWPLFSEYKDYSSFVYTDDQLVGLDGDSLADAVKHSLDCNPIGVVIGILERPDRIYCGTLKIPFTLKVPLLDSQFASLAEQPPSGSTAVAEKFAHVAPYSSSIPATFIQSSQSLAPFVGQRITFVIDCWDASASSPRGHILQILGDVGDRSVEAEVLLREYDIRHFDLQVNSKLMRELPRLKDGQYIIPPDELGRRADFRDEYVCSVDPPSCMDIDDALHFKRLPLPYFLQNILSFNSVRNRDALEGIIGAFLDSSSTTSHPVDPTILNSYIRKCSDDALASLESVANQSPSANTAGAELGLAPHLSEGGPGLTEALASNGVARPDAAVVVPAMKFSFSETGGVADFSDTYVRIVDCDTLIRSLSLLDDAESGSSLLSPTQRAYLLQTVTNIFKDKVSLGEVGVHIADVSHYVKPDSCIDVEARQRGTSVYFCDRRIDMLPKLLTEDICSLRSWVDRLAFSCVALLDMRTGRLVHYSFAKSVIHSRLSLSYSEAQWLVESPTATLREIYDPVANDLQRMLSSGQLRQKHAEHMYLSNKQRSDSSPPLDICRVQDSLRCLLALSQKLKASRMANGALALDAPVPEYDLDPETGMPKALHEHAQLPTMSMIEEFMVFANVCAARETLRQFPTFAVLRRHPEPSEQQLSKLACQVKAIYGYDLDARTNLSLATSINDIEAKNPEAAAIVRVLLTRCMNLAKYFPASAFTAEEFRHYGLAMDVYTHFTSPIRRYSDVLVHRLLAAGLGADSLPAFQSSPEKVSAICDNLNTRKENADNASRGSNRIFGALFVLKNMHMAKSLVCQSEIVRISCSKSGAIINVMLTKFGIEGEIRVPPDSLESVSESGLSISLRGTELQPSIPRALRLFERVSVSVGFDFEHIYEFRMKVKLLE